MEYYSEGSYTSTILVRTMPHLESILGQEILGLGLPVVREHRRMIETTGSLLDVYRCNLYLRTALRVLLPIQAFAMRQPDDLYRKAVKIDWSQFLGIDQTFAIDSTVHSSYFKHNHFASL
ncbi:MAG: THUMP domain-containing protein, partial [Flavobacteriales bacterium]